MNDLFKSVKGRPPPEKVAWEKGLEYNKKYAFTLAEVLITLGIIGVVAALTIPAIIGNYRKQEASVRLKKFYGTMEQVIRRAEIDFGSSQYWTRSTKGLDTFKQYLAPYMPIVKIQDENSTNPTIYFEDGSFFQLHDGDCLDFNFDINGAKRPNANGRDRFYFPMCFSETSRESWHGNKDKIFGTYEGLATSRTEAYSLCQSKPQYCSRLLQIDNWEIKNDFPQKF